MLSWIFFLNLVTCIDAKTIHPLSKINPASECWRIMVRVVRLYTLPLFGEDKTTNSMEMIFMDEHGSTIHATVRRSLLGTFRNKISEGLVYVFAYFGIGNSGGYYRTSRHEFRLNFHPRTTVTECSDAKIPIYGLKLIAFPEILQADSNYPYLVGKEKDIVKESRRTKMIVITIEAEGMTLDVTLFGEYVDMVKSFIQNQLLEHSVIVIQYAKVKTFQGHIILQNVMCGTHLLFNNHELEEVIQFRQSVRHCCCPEQYWGLVVFGLQVQQSC